MTTGELIAALQAIDPSGDTPVCVGNADVYFVQRHAAYYDGALQQLIHDQTKRNNAWSIIGAKIITRGEKVDIVTMSIRDVLVDMPDLPIEGGDPETIARWRKESQED